MLSRVEKLAKLIKDNTPSLAYIKLSKNCRNLLTVDYNGFKLHNIVDIYALRKRLIQVKDIEKLSHEKLIGHYYREFNFGGDKDIDFHANFENANLQSVMKACWY